MGRLLRSGSRAVSQRSRPQQVAYIGECEYQACPQTGAALPDGGCQSRCVRSRNVLDWHTRCKSANFYRVTDWRLQPLVPAPTQRTKPSLAVIEALHTFF